MKKLVFIVVAAALIACIGLLVPRASGDPRWFRLELESQVMEETRPLLVRLPRDYERDADRRYPVVYKLDGDNALWRYDDTLDILQRVGAATDMIVVAISNTPGNRDRDLTPSHMTRNGETDGGAGGGDRFLRFIVDELVPYIDTRYRTSSRRVLAGHSRGGLLVVHSLLTQPGAFDAHLAFSPALWRDDHQIVKDAATRLAEGTGFLFLTLGELENPKMRAGYAAFVQALERQSQPALRWVAEDTPGGDHSSTQIMALPRAIQLTSATVAPATMAATTR